MTTAEARAIVWQQYPRACVEWRTHATYGRVCTIRTAPRGCAGVLIGGCMRSESLAWIRAAQWLTYDTRHPPAPDAADSAA